MHILNNRRSVAADRLRNRRCLNLLAFRGNQDAQKITSAIDVLEERDPCWGAFEMTVARLKSAVTEGSGVSSASPIAVRGGQNVAYTCLIHQ
jgi:hypothetical protein